MSGGKVYRNTLPHSCPSLGFEEAFTYETSLSQLCSTDIITTIDQPSGSYTGNIFLGDFVPYTKDS